MTSEGSSPKARHLGRVIDPLAREDGGSDPVVEAGEPLHGVKPGVGSAVATPHPVRDKLIARIREAREKSAVDTPSGDVPSERFGALGGLSEELERIARAPTMTPRRSKLRLGETPLSPNTIALFGIVFGLAALASLFAALAHWAPRGSSAVSPAAPPTMATESVASVAVESPPAPAVERRARAKLPGPWRIADADKSGLRRLEGKIGDQSFLKAVTAAGLDIKQAYRVLAALKEEKNLDRCAKSDRFLALVEAGSGRLSAFEYVVSVEEIYQARENERGELKGTRLDLKVERVRARGALLISAGPFEAAALASGFEASIGGVINKALEGHTSVEQFRPGDRLRVIAQEVTVLGEFSRYAGIEAVEYLPVGSDEPLRLYYFQGEQSKGYVNAKGQLLSEGGWRRPVKNAPITSRFNPKRMHPVLKVIKPHTGTDFGAPTGTPVFAALFGTVRFVGPLGPNGNFVEIDHKGGYQTGYSHLSRFAEGLKVGDKVKTLQVIGYIGSTGRSTGPHLHFSVKKAGVFIDAESLRLDSLGTLPAKERDAFARTKRTYDELLDAILLPPVPAQPAPATVPPAPSNDDMEYHDPAATAQGAPAIGTTMPVPGVAAAQPPAAPSPAAQAHPGSAIYLSDRDLMLAQPQQSDGESDE